MPHPGSMGHSILQVCVFIPPYKALLVPFTVDSFECWRLPCWKHWNVHQKFHLRTHHRISQEHLSCLCRIVSFAGRWHVQSSSRQSYGRNRSQRRAQILKSIKNFLWKRRYWKQSQSWKSCNIYRHKKCVKVYVKRCKHVRIGHLQWTEGVSFSYSDDMEAAALKDSRMARIFWWLFGTFLIFVTFFW